MNATWLRWLALSMFWPSQQLWNSKMRTTWLPRGQSGYLSVSLRFSKPVQVQKLLAFAVPFVNDLASPVMMRRNFGGATTLLVGLPRKVRVTEVGRRIRPTLPSRPPPGWLWSNSRVPTSRSTGQKYADLSPLVQVVPAASRLSFVDWPLVEVL